jgi:type I restriction enzyme S subunit
MKQAWKIKELGDVCEVIAGQSPEGKFYNTANNGLPFYQGKKEFTDRYIGKPTTWTTKITKEAQIDDILMSVRAPVGPINFATQKICIGRGLASIRAGRLIDKDFLFNFLLKHENEIVGNTGAVFNSINKNQIEKIKIPIPPLPEQQKIVAILDKAFSAIDQAKQHAEQNLKNAKELFNNYLTSIFTNKGADWEEKTLNEVCDLKSGTTIPISIEREFGDILYTKIADMNLPENLIEINTSSRFVNSNEINLNQIIPVGAIIFPKRGGAIATNKKRKIVKPTIVDLNTMAIIPSKKIDKDFLFFWFNLIDLNQISNGTSIPQINNYSFDDIYLPYPISLIEQHAIAQRLNILSAKTKQLESIYQQKITELEELKKSILQKAFNGELTQVII